MTREELRKLCNEMATGKGSFEERMVATFAIASALPALLDELDERDRPCMWEEMPSSVLSAYKIGCNGWLNWKPEFCPNCGHRVEVKK